jgi:hypothetical protein
VTYYSRTYIIWNYGDLHGVYGIPSREMFPLQVVYHVGYAACVMVSTRHKACCSPLYSFQFIFVLFGIANKLLGFLRRNLKVRNETTKENAYKAIVRSNLEYCSTVWSPHTKKNKDELERAGWNSIPHVSSHSSR